MYDGAPLEEERTREREREIRNRIFFVAPSFRGGEAKTMNERDEEV
jgi:hypothetical protein